MTLEGLSEEMTNLLKAKMANSSDASPSSNKIAAVRLIPIRATGLLPAKGKERQVFIDVSFGDAKQRAEAKQVSSKHCSFKWAVSSFDFPLLPSNRDSKMKIKVLDEKNNEPLGYIGFSVKDLPELKGEKGMHLAWHTLRKCAGQQEVSGKLRFCICYVDSAGAPIGT